MTHNLGYCFNSRSGGGVSTLQDHVHARAARPLRCACGSAAHGRCALAEKLALESRGLIALAEWLCGAWLAALRERALSQYRRRQSFLNRFERRYFGGLHSLFRSISVPALGAAGRSCSYRCQTAGKKCLASRTALFDHYFRDEQSAASFIGGHARLRTTRLGAVVAKAFDLVTLQAHWSIWAAPQAIYALPRAQPGRICKPPCSICRRWKNSRSRISKVRGLSERVRFLTADFFADPLPPADLYSLGRILHDWHGWKDHKAA